MAAKTLSAVDGRAVVKCVDCKLIQFSASDGICPRCKRPYIEPEPIEPEPEPIAVAPLTPTLSAAQALAASVRAIRKLRGLSQRGLAARLGTARTWVSKIENLSCVPTLSSLEHLAVALEVPLAALVSERERSRSETINELLTDQLLRSIASVLPKLPQTQREGVLLYARDLQTKAQSRRLDYSQVRHLGL
jgi:transcriptional regulator with XRE-family HTH domain